MQFVTHKRDFKMPTRFTFSCDYGIAKMIKENSKHFNYCQSDLIKTAIVELCERLEKDKQNAINK